LKKTVAKQTWLICRLARCFGLSVLPVQGAEGATVNACGARTELPHFSGFIFPFHYFFDPFSFALFPLAVYLLYL